MIVLYYLMAMVCGVVTALCAFAIVALCVSIVLDWLEERGD